MKMVESSPAAPITPILISDAESVPVMPGVDSEDIDNIKNTAQIMLQRGSVDFEELVEYLRDSYPVEEDDVTDITSLAESVLYKLISEQAEWPKDEMEDMRKLISAFRALERKGVVSRASYSCCSRCGNGEIRAEALSQHVGYCYFHEQDLDACIERRGLVLRHGVIGDDFEDLKKRTEIARILVQTMEEAGLKVIWNQDPEKVIELPGFKWRVRLHDGSAESEEEQQDVRGDDRQEDEGTDLGIPQLDFYVR